MVNHREFMDIMQPRVHRREKPTEMAHGIGRGHPVEIDSQSQTVEILGERDSNVSVGPEQLSQVESQASLSHTNRHSTPRGQQPSGPKFKNFRSSEDLCLALAYKDVTTDASVGTDQDANTYWEKIAAIFASTIGNELIQVRDGKSLKNRWNSQIQPIVLKFVGFLTQSLRSFHSGWSMADYVNEAKQNFMLHGNSEFKFDTVYNAIKSLPKFAIPVHEISPRTRAALGFEGNDVPKEDPRPTVGKKKAKSLKHEQQMKENKGAQLDARAEAMLRMATAAEEKTKVFSQHLQERQRLEFFNSCGDETARDEFFSLKKEDYLLSVKVDIAAKENRLEEQRSISAKRKEVEQQEGQEDPHVPDEGREDTYVADSQQTSKEAHSGDEPEPFRETPLE